MRDNGTGSCQEALRTASRAVGRPGAWLCLRLGDAVGLAPEPTAGGDGLRGVDATADVVGGEEWAELPPEQAERHTASAAAVARGVDAVWR